MADLQTATIRLTQPTVGGDSGTWATLLNNDLAFTDEAVNQTATVNVPETNVVLVADAVPSFGLISIHHSLPR
jgi:hypothetical protein